MSRILAVPLTAIRSAVSNGGSKGYARYPTERDEQRFASLRIMAGLRGYMRESKMQLYRFTLAAMTRF